MAICFLLPVCQLSVLDRDGETAIIDVLYLK